MSVQYKGVNISGLEFGGSAGKPGYNYAVPTKAQYEYWGDNVGANIVRIPFRWERLQKSEFADLDKQYLGFIKSQVAYAQANGMVAILDMHNYASYGGKQIGSIGGPTTEAFSDAWIKLAKEFCNDPNVWINMMNEPHAISATKWAGISQDFVIDLRDAGIENKILVSGASWSGAHSWTKSGNGDAFAKFYDPMDNYAFDVHQYFDKDSSGTSGKVVENAANRLIAVTKWAEANGHKLFLGEFGASDPNLPGQQFAQSEVTKAIQYMDSHAGQWLGWSVWGAGPWWNENYHFEINPTNIGKPNVTDDSIMSYLRPLFEIKPTLTDDPLSFRAQDFTSYSSRQDGKGMFSVSDNHQEVTLKGNAWKKIELDYAITKDTVLSIDFRSTQKGEVQGIGLDSDNRWESAFANFKLYGTQGVEKFNTAYSYDGSGEWQHFDIRVGDIAAGKYAEFLTFFNDDDRKNALSDASYRNIKVHEKGDIITAATYIGTEGKDVITLDIGSLATPAHIRGFSAKGGDVLDFGKLLEAAHPDQAAIDKFIRVTESGNDSTVSIDRSGSGAHFVKVATIYDAVGMTDEKTMVTKGTFDIA